MYLLLFLFGHTIVALLLWKFINSASLGSGSDYDVNPRRLHNTTTATGHNSSRSKKKPTGGTRTKSTISAFVDKY